jgi:4'-phosphopantetheinyl transferase
LSRLPKNEDPSSSATLWLLDGSDLQDNDLKFFAARLSASEKRRFANFTRTARRRQFLLGRMLLRFAVAHLTGLASDQFSVVEKSDNPPQLTFRDRRLLSPKFSLSHSHDWVACAISVAATLGVDIEVNKANRDVASISDVAFHPSEQIWLGSQPRTERIPAFYSLWCAKEAVYKLLCNLNQESDASPLVGQAGRHHYQLPVADLGLTAVIFSDRPLAAIHQRILRGFSSADWRVVAENCCGS